MANHPKLDRIAEEAIEWMTLLRSGEATDHDRARFQAWRNRDLRHEAAAARLDWALGVFTVTGEEASSRQIVRDTLLHIPSRRHALKAVLAFSAFGITAGVVADCFTPVSCTFSDLRTATGERRRVRLADGTTLILNARSGVDVDLAASKRTIRLRRGEVFVDVAHDASRPFFIATREGHVRALGTRFSVKVEDGTTNVSVLSSAVEVTAARGARQRVEAGSSARFDNERILEVAPLNTAESGWIDGQIVVKDQPLSEVVDRLRPYFPGWIAVSGSAAPLHVSGVFHMDHIDQAIDALVEAAPIRVRRQRKLWAYIDTI